MKKTFLKITGVFVSAFIFAALLANVLPVAAAFGAGMTPGWTQTSKGLSGLFQFGSYKFSPDSYNLDDSVTLKVDVKNNKNTNVSTNMTLYVYRIVKYHGENVRDGQPDQPGINENDLYYKGNKSKTVFVKKINIGTVNIPKNSMKTFTMPTYTFDKTGYYKIWVGEKNDLNTNYNAKDVVSIAYMRVLDNGSMMEDQEEL